MPTSGGRARPLERWQATVVAGMPPTPGRGLPGAEPMQPGPVERIHEASSSILEDVGVVFRDPIALDDWKNMNADVRGEKTPRIVPRGE